MLAVLKVELSNFHLKITSTESTSDDEGIEMTVISNKDTLVHGGYGPWSPFSACTNSCDGGTKIRYFSVSFQVLNKRLPLINI